ncbi:hypothetical protein NKR19_g6547 [Coniochaeta hoffmannii]|uniref:Uncharacterized protein n=1 Tax=Coniochaeta hoffmannii TaxID=91930 RepID=A0AA38VPW5_9PEZI|nr:hypothetical protein NKR19_g6547 [Coniochaeta hoffmannii]
MSSSAAQHREAPNPLLCKFYPYTRCKETFPLDQRQAWKEHVWSHYVKEKNLVDAIKQSRQEPAISCWIPCGHPPLEVNIVGDSDAKAQFFAMMEHIYAAHMRTASVDWKDLRNDDGGLVRYYWETYIKPAVRSGEGLTVAEARVLAGRYVLPL